MTPQAHLQSQKQSKQLPPVTFLRVTDVHSKLMRICDTVFEHVSQGQKVLISVDDDASANFVDNLLWRLPEESFIPHIISDTECEDSVVITTLEINLNKAFALISLKSTANPMAKNFSVIYELSDHTVAKKLELSQQRYSVYQREGFPLSEI
ncbi:MAG: DNA polymerase-3 subunit chi [Chlamydiales bacterium]|jgi:DNA polymerase-3 subunit chi